ncbi:hypothetical protein GpartN1_g5865.t1 [Galdieria partita]|uniref:Uncharacterized protein n=1 Tax=Galdieria partita TaxID=83374 RepID=A0A9C7Q1E5_9RHOD|nr:hypothetical protein GpartN1_g5865.t1 [Galdieria partita]
MENSSTDSFEINSSVKSSSSTSGTFDSSFSANVERGREILMFLKSSKMKYHDINSDLDDYGTSSSSDVDELNNLSPDMSSQQDKNRMEETFIPRVAGLNEKKRGREKSRSPIGANVNELIMENHRTQIEINSARERNAALSQRLEHLMDKLSHHKSEKKTYLHRMEILKQEVTYLKNELQEYHSQSKSVREREYDLQSQLKGLQIKHEQLLKEYMELKERVAILKQKLETKEILILQMKEKEEKHFELEETWKLERDSLVRGYEDCLLKYEQLEKTHERLQSKLENDEEQFATVERVLRKHIEELERKEKAKEMEMENLRNEKDFSQDELQQMKIELAQKTENIRNYETQLICNEEALRFSKEAATRLQQQLHDWLQKREQLENRLEEREKQNGLLYLENTDLRRTLKEYQDKLSEQQTKIELYKDRIKVFDSVRNLLEEKAPKVLELTNKNRLDSTQQTDISGPVYEDDLERLFSRMSKLFVDSIHQVQHPNEKHFQITSGRGSGVLDGESSSISYPIVKNPNSSSVRFTVENSQVSDISSFTKSKNKVNERDFDKLQDEQCNISSVNERIDRNAKNQPSQVDEWKLKLMEWKFLLDVNMKREFLSIIEDENVAETVDRLSEELVLLVSKLEKFQSSSYQVSSNISIEQNSSKSSMKPEQENIALGAILTHIRQLRNLWLHEVEINRILRGLLLSTGVTGSHLSGKLCEFPQLSSDGYSCLQDCDYLDQETIE